MKKRNLYPGDVVQLVPEHKCGRMLLVVTEPKDFGCQGYLLSEDDAPELVKYKGKAYIRPNFDEIEYVGKLPFFEDREDDIN